MKEGDVVLARCDYCGRKFSTPPNRYKKSKYHFCSRECYIKWMRTNPEIMSKKGKNKISQPIGDCWSLQNAGKYIPLNAIHFKNAWDNINDLAKSKMEAFNLGRNVAVENLMTVLLRMVDETEDEIKQRVKSAVQGFIKEVKFYTDEDGDCLLPTDEIIELVKKWLPDVVEGEE